MKLKIGTQPDQKKPEQEDPTLQELYDLYKEERGKSAIYKKHGEWHESQEFQKWKNEYLSALSEEVNEMMEDESDMEEAVELVNHGEKLTKKFSEIGTCENCEIERPINPKTNLCRECEVLPATAEDIERAIEKQKQDKTKPKYIKSTELGKAIKYFHHIEFLWELMGTKMDFVETPTKEDIEYLTKLKELLNK